MCPVISVQFCINNSVSRVRIISGIDIFFIDTIDTLVKST